MGQQNLHHISPARLSVSVGAEGEALDEDAVLQPYFVRNLKGEVGPGQSKKTALVVTDTFQPLQQQQKTQGKLSLVLYLFLVALTLHALIVLQ